MKTTKQDFEDFRKECQQWLDRFGLSDWDNQFQHAKLDDDAQAQVEHNSQGKVAVFSLNTNIDPYQSVFDLALHEALEALLAGMDIMARERKWDEDAWTQERHSVINRLMRVLKDKS
jgi:hypothetical protein